MPEKMFKKVSSSKKRAPILLIMLLIITLPALIATSAFGLVGKYHSDDNLIYPNTFIAGIDVSNMTKEEALNALNLQVFEERAKSAQVTIIFPDYSELTITSLDINLANDAEEVVESAFMAGRRNGFIQNTWEYIRRLNGKIFDLTIQNSYDINNIQEIVNEFVDDYNERLSTSKPQIYNDKIVITKGAGSGKADEMILSDLAYIGLFESFEKGAPVEFAYALPETITDSRQLLDIYQKVFIPVESSQLDLSTLSASQCVVGVEFDVIEAVSLLNNTQTGKTVTLDVFYVQPETTQEYLEGLLFRDLLGQQETHVAGSQDRVTNIKVSSETINGLVLMPGDEFSFNDVVGRRTARRGYRTGGAYVGGVLVPVIGGGVCQTASTLYAAIVDTEILVTERHGHSKAVPYLPRGRDATVFWEKLDLRFVNNTDYPIRLDFELVDRKLTASVYGTIIDDFPTPAMPIPAG